MGSPSFSNKNIKTGLALLRFILNKESSVLGDDEIIKLSKKMRIVFILLTSIYAIVILFNLMVTVKKFIVH
jgi:hypothetical protein